MQLNPPLAIVFVCRGRRIIATPTSRMEDDRLLKKMKKGRKMMIVPTSRMDDNRLLTKKMKKKGRKMMIVPTSRMGDDTKKMETKRKRETIGY